MVIRSFLIVLTALILSISMVHAAVPTAGQYQGEYQMTIRAAPLGGILGMGVNKAHWTWDFDTDTAVVAGTTLSVGFNYALHDLDDTDKSQDILHFVRNNDGTITLSYALQIYHPGLGYPMANATTTFRFEQNGAELVIKTIDKELDGTDGILGTKIYNVFPVTIEPDLMGSIVQEGSDSNQDGIDDKVALTLGLDPNKLDTDNDGISDFDEIGSDQDNPLDSDADSMIDALEFGDSAFNSQQASGLLTENKQDLTVETSAPLTIQRASVGSMHREVTNADSSDDFASLDSTLGQPGINYLWGNLSLSLATSSNTLGQTQVSLEFSQPLPQSLLIYGLNQQGKYQLLSGNDWYRDSANKVRFSVKADSPWVMSNSTTSTYELTLAVAENTLGGVNLDEDSISTGGSLDGAWLLLLSLCFIGRYHHYLSPDKNK